MNILERILEQKRREVAERKESHPIHALEQSQYFGAAVKSLKRALTGKEATGIIAEIKRKSPSRGVINAQASVNQISVGYVQAGASALSILTDHEFFGGSSADLVTGRNLNACPILRKDFVLDEYQVIESKSMGADVILLIAAAMPPVALKNLCTTAHTLGLEVLLEVHDESELNTNLESGADLVGVNNRNLKTFEVNVETSRRLSALIPDPMVRVSESGIESPDSIVDLKSYGFRGFLIGQTFMQEPNPGQAASDFVRALRKLEANS